jgi:porin
MAFNWGHPSEPTPGPKLREQHTWELFYRFQVADELAITPDVQAILHPAPNRPRTWAGWIFGIRGRLVL